MVFNLALTWSDFPTLSYFFPLSPIFLSFPPKELSIGIIRFFLVLAFSSFWASWVVLAAAHFAFWEVQGISNTPRIISALQKSHEMVFNLALCYLGFPNLSYFSLFCSIFRSFPFSMGIICFFRFWLFPVSGRVGWFWQPLTLLFEKCKASPIPLE